MAAGFHWRTSASQAGTFLSASIAGMENITPDAYIQVRSTNGISCARSGVLLPIRAKISASPVLNTNWSTRAGTTSSQDAAG